LPLTLRGMCALPHWAGKRYGMGEIPFYRRKEMVFLSIRLGWLRIELQLITAAAVNDYLIVNQFVGRLDGQADQPDFFKKRDVVELAGERAIS
jgi:hypothetical protein